MRGHPKFVKARLVPGEADEVSPLVVRDIQHFGQLLR